MKLTRSSYLMALAIAGLTSNVNAEQTQQDRISELEKKVAVLEAQQSSSNLLDRFTIGGYASFVAAQMSEATGGYMGYTDDEVDFTAGSLAAIRMQFDVNDKATAVFQLTAKGAEDWDPEFEWAYMSYQFDNGVLARAGRLRTPLFLLSDYLTVGYAVTTARVPTDVYNGTPDTIDGIDMLIPLQLGDAMLTFQPLMGNTAITDGSVEVNLDKFYGMAVESAWDSLRLRASHFRIDEVTGDLAGNPIEETTGKFTGIGAAWDDGSFIAQAEWVQIETEGAMLRDQESYYLMLGYRIDAFPPYLQYSEIETTDDEERAPLFPAGMRSSQDLQRTTYSAGVRWDFAPSMAVKLDVTMIDDFGTTSGDLPVNSNGLVVAQNVEDAALYTLQFDVIF